MLLLSGCSGSSSSSSSSGFGNGLTVHSFDFSSNEVSSGHPSILTLSMQNLGSKDIADVYIYLYGLSRGTDEWFEGDPPDISVSGADSLVGGDSRILKLDSVGAPIKSMDLDGESRTVLWVIDAPRNLPKDKVFEYSVGVRVCYPYVTTSVGKIEVLDEQEYLSKEIDKTIKSHNIVLDTTAGPLGIDMSTQQPLLLTNNNDITFKVKVIDRGGGTVTESDCSNAFNWNNDVLDLLTLNNIDVSINGDACDIGINDLYFKIAESGRATAEFPVTCSVPSFDGPTCTFDLNIKFTYNYFVDAMTDISVEGLGDDTI